MQAHSPSTPRLPPPSSGPRLNANARRVRPSLHSSSIPASLGTTQQYSSDSDLTLETTLHHLTDFLTRSLPDLGYSQDAITILRECIAIHLTPKLAPSWDMANPSSGCGIRSLIAMPGKFPTPLVNAAKDAGVDVVKWAKGMSPSGEWELWVDPGSICFRDGGWAWVDEGFESRGYKQTLHTIWQTPIVPHTPLGTSSNIANSSPFTTSHFPIPPNSAPSAPVGSSRLINPKLYTNAAPIRAPAVFRIPPPPLPASLVPGFGKLSLGNGSTDSGLGRGTPIGGERKVALSAFRSDGAIEDDGWGEISQKLGERGQLLMDAAMGEGRGLRKQSNPGYSDGQLSEHRLSAFGLLPSVDISFGAAQANKRISIGSAPGSERSRDRSVSGESSTGMRSIGGDETSDRGDDHTRDKRSGHNMAAHDPNTRDEDGIIFLDTGLLAAIEGSGDEGEERAKRTPLPATPLVEPRSRTPSSDVEFIVSRHGTPILGVPGDSSSRWTSPSTPQGAGIIHTIAETPQSETSDATTIKANRNLVTNFDSEQMMRLGGLNLPSSSTNGAPRPRSSGSSAVPSVQPYDGGNVGVLGGGVKLGGLSYHKAPVAAVPAIPGPEGGSSAAAALAGSASQTASSRGRSSGSASTSYDAGHQYVQMGLGPYSGAPGIGVATSSGSAYTTMNQGYHQGQPLGPFIPTPMFGQHLGQVAPPPLNQSIKEGKVGMIYPLAGKKRRGRPTARSTAHAQNGPPSLTTSLGNGTAVVERPGKANHVVAAAIASFEGPGRWTGLPGQQVQGQMQGRESSQTGTGATDRRSRQNANKVAAQGGSHRAGGLPMVQQMPQQQAQTQPRWNVGGGMGMPVQGMNPPGVIAGLHHQPVLGTGISGQPGSGMVLANMQQLHQHQQQMLHMGNVQMSSGWEGMPPMLSNSAQAPPMGDPPSVGLSMLPPGVTAASVEPGSTAKGLSPSLGKGSVPTAFGVPSGATANWQRNGALPPPFVPSGSNV